MAWVAPNGGGMASGSMPLFSKERALNTVLGLCSEVSDDWEGAGLLHRDVFRAPDTVHTLVFKYL